MRIAPLVVAIAILMPASASGDETRFYLTTGTGKVQTCKGIGFQACEYESVTAPTEIDQLRLGTSIWHEDKGDGLTMCYEQIKKGIWTERLLMFKCTPIQEP